MRRIVEVEECDRIALVWMKQHPVNTMTMHMWTQLAEALHRVESNPAMQGIAFLSGVSKDVFTAGNDIAELYAPNTSLERYRYGSSRVSYPLQVCDCGTRLGGV